MMRLVAVAFVLALAPYPRAGAVCLAAHFTGNLLAPARLYPLPVIASVFVQGNWK